VRLCRSLGRLAVAAVVGLSFACGGCSFRMASLIGNKEADSVDQTGSIQKTSAPNQPLTASGKPSAQPSEFDLAYARAAAAEVLTRGGKDTSVPWENPQTGARGNITPLASNYSEGGFTCRDFLASYVREGAEAWLQGEACRMTQGKWEVKTLRPWKQT
jgi:surface antigen